MMAWSVALLTGIGLGVLGNEVFAWLPWLTCKTVRLAARIDADCPEEIDDLYADMMVGVTARPGPLAALCTAAGLLIKVAVARRVRNAIVAGYSAVLVRVHLGRVALAGHGALPSGAPPVGQHSGFTSPTATEAASTQPHLGAQAVHRPSEAINETDDDSWALVGAAQNGDSAAFGKLYQRYVEIVFRYLLFRISDRELAQDLTSETFLRAFRRISAVSYQGHDVGAWLVTIARSLVLEHVKSSRYRLEVTTAEISDTPLGLERSSGHPEYEALAAATNAELMRCVAHLNPDQQECILLRFMQGLSMAEAAAIMGRNKGMVKALQFRALHRLAQLLPQNAL